MLVDSSGSRNPPARPIATTLRFQVLRRRPAVKRSGRGIRQRLALEPRQQLGRGLVVADEIAAVDVAVAHAVLQRNAPLPAGLARRGARIGRERAGVLAGHGHGAVAGQPVGPFVVAGLEGCSISRPRKPEQSMNRSPLDHLAAVEFHRLDPAVLAAQFDVDDLAVGALHAALLPRSRAGSGRTARRRTGRRSRRWTSPTSDPRTAARSGSCATPRWAASSPRCGVASPSAAAAASSCGTARPRCCEP